MHSPDWAKRWAHYAPDKIAVSEYESGRSLTYRHLNNAANHLSRHLRDTYQLKKGDRVAILAENTLEHFILFSAAQKTGLILVPLNYRLAPPEIELLLQDCSCRLLIAEADLLTRQLSNTQSASYRVLNIGEIRKYCNRLKEIVVDDFERVDVDESDPLLILYTSGTTGIPKGVLYTHKMLFWNSVNTALRLDITSEDRTIMCAPLFHTGGWNVLSTPFLHRGANFCLLRKFEPDIILRLLQTESATLFFGVPTMLRMLAEEAAFHSANLENLRYCIVGGEAMPLSLIEIWHARGVPIRQGYGMTEAGPNLTSLHQSDAVKKIGSIGQPNFYVETRIVDESGHTAGTGRPGELLLRGPIVTPGYWNRPEETARVIRNGWLHTGDIVYEDEDGYLYVVDRKKNMYISGGENVYPVEVERVLRSYPDIDEAVVIGVPDETWGETGKAFIVSHRERNPAIEEIKEFLQLNLAKYKIPKYFCFLEELPKGDTGKINRKALRDIST